jgi:anoctamin-10/anoctamin-7
LEQLLAKKALLHAFPLHDRTELRALQGRWLLYWAWPWKQPFTRIKDYFGEKVKPVLSIRCVRI